VIGDGDYDGLWMMMMMTVMLMVLSQQKLQSALSSF
jgi:hypothetical protein